MLSYHNLLRYLIGWSEDDGTLVLRYPQELHSLATVAPVVEDLRTCNLLPRDTRLKEEGNVWQLELQMPADQSWDRTALLFSRLNGFPYTSPLTRYTPSRAAAPLVSCIVVLCANDAFVQRQLLPSLVYSSAGYPIEILIVYNGLGAELDSFAPIPIVPSPLGIVSVAYNRGVEAARGKYVAIFHDDCLLHDASWIDKCITALDSGMQAVTPEVHRTTFGFDCLKCVPLFMKRRDYLDAGGFDERIVVGFEDLDFTCRLLRQGRPGGKVSLNYWHLNGMSTALLYDNAPAQLKRIFECLMLPARLTRQICTSTYTRFCGAAEFQSLIDRQKAQLLANNSELLSRHAGAPEHSIDLPSVDVGVETAAFQHLILKHSRISHPPNMTS